MNQNDYPICPRCGGRVIAALLKSGAIRNGGINNINSPYFNDLYYNPESIYLSCTGGDCNYDIPLSNLTKPPIIESA